jgi:hypothetical protein
MGLLTKLGNGTQSITNKEITVGNKNSNIINNRTIKHIGNTDR